jgi:hypothetical protein
MHIWRSFSIIKGGLPSQWGTMGSWTIPFTALHRGGRLPRLRRGAFLVLNALTFHIRENKNAYDVFYLLRNYGRNVSDTRVLSGGRR